ncbi:RHS repeat-associated core domain-containing protein [Dictyobacter arantiisoli]|uniref:Intein C-terminal splicing domain-containing protein n=1 Tax=Dictyobacter arantiisoli TaxID=2014874 RepID=A0A5A5TKW9_9CHLR|nr:RHS repeat-associated core domain-containing protein [Dictyobacter arantiisoli]GCF11756.1 hypothetical protein KDI_53200 [Dictyobacter arantiisoli]
MGGQTVAMRKDGILSYLVPDFLGSVSLSLYADGSVQAVQLFSPFGGIRYSDGSIPTSYSFTGQRFDSITGLLYYGARYYDPVSGRFISADSVETNGAGLDAYAYVKGNPETATDPTGHGQCFAEDDSGCVGVPGPGTPGQPSSPPAQQPPAQQPPAQQPSPPVNQGCVYDCGPGPNTGGTPMPVKQIMSYKPPVCDQLCQDEKDSLLPSLAMLAFEGIVAADIFNPETEVTDDEAIPGTLSKIGAGIDAFTCSFTAATLVFTSTGEMPIGVLKPGNVVWAYNGAKKQTELEPIKHVWINHDNDLVDLTLTTKIEASKGKPAHEISETLHTNQKHPFLTVEKGFLSVAQLKLGMHVVEASGRAGVVTGWKSVPGTQTMYNLEVTQDHTYAVGAGQWVVHNETPACIDPQTLSDAGNAPDKGGMTRAGRAFQKHVSRVDGSQFGTDPGKPALRNQMGQYTLDDILTHPDLQWTQNYYSSDKKYVLDGYIPDGRGVRYSLPDLFFMGFRSK